MKKLTQTILILLFTAVFILFSVGCPDDVSERNDKKRARSTLENEGEQIPLRDEKIYSNATIEADFDVSSLLVILDNFLEG